MRVDAVRRAPSAGFAGTSPAARLGHLHICIGVTGSKDLELGQAVVESDWAGWSVRCMSGPSAEPGVDPCGPGKGVLAMRVALQLGGAVYAFVEGVEHLDLVGRKGNVSGKLFVAVAGLDELNDDGCGFGCDGDQLDE